MKDEMYNHEMEKNRPDDYGESYTSKRSTEQEN